MADEVDSGNRTSAEVENDQTAMESALNTPVSDPALESVRVKIAAAADRKFQAAANVRKEHETSVAEFEAQKAGFIDQVRKQVVFSALEKPDDQNVFMRSTYNYGADYRGNAGPALWQLLYASDGSGT